MSVIAYERRLDSNRRWALEEGGLHFERQSEVYRSLEKIARRLTDLGIPYVVAGGMDLFLHGYRRFTEYVDLLVTRDSLARIHAELEGRGYLPPFVGSKHLRDTETGVRIEFLITGDYPGDGKPKPVSFPDPVQVRKTIDDLECLPLEKLVELKLASGTSPGRRKDLGDVQELIRILHLPLEFAKRLDPTVQLLFGELWSELQSASPENN